MRFYAVLAVLAAGSGSLCAQTSILAQSRPRARDFSKNLAPYVASPQPVVEKMLEAGRLKAGETVYDLGCGDGRILITAVEKFKAKAVGVELAENLARIARENIHRRNFDEMAKVIQANMLDVDLSPADVVTIYLMSASNEVLRPQLEKQLRPGARVVSHGFEVKGWKAARIESVDVAGRSRLIYVYEMPQKH